MSEQPMTYLTDRDPADERETVYRDAVIRSSIASMALSGIDVTREEAERLYDAVTDERPAVPTVAPISDEDLAHLWDSALPGLLARLDQAEHDCDEARTALLACRQAMTMWASWEDGVPMGRITPTCSGQMCGRGRAVNTMLTRLLCAVFGHAWQTQHSRHYHWTVCQRCHRWREQP